MKDILLVIARNKEDKLLQNSDIIKMNDTEVTKTTSLEEAMEMLSQSIKVNMVVMNYNFDNGRATTIFQFMKQKNLHIPVIIVLQEGEEKLITQAMIDGACAVFVQPVKESELLLSVRNIMNLTRTQATLKASETIIEALSKSLEFKDGLTKGHAKRVADLSLKVYDEMGFRNYDERYKLYIGALLHDIGKVGIPDDILKSPKKFDRDGEEMEVLKTHPKMGFEMSLGVKDQTVLDIILNHHEKLDGSGYPRGLVAKELSIPVRIVTVVDIFDSLIHKRNYSEPLPLLKSFQILEKEALDNKISYDIYRVFKNLVCGSDPHCKDILEDDTAPITD